MKESMIYNEAAIYRRNPQVNFDFEIRKTKKSRSKIASLNIRKFERKLKSIKIPDSTIKKVLSVL